MDSARPTHVTPSLVASPKTYTQVTEDIARHVFARPRALWTVGFLLAGAASLVGFGAIVYEIAIGIGVWGVNRTIGWGFAITNFVFWIGIGHAGTLISAILFLFRQRWRTSISRAAEAMTIFAVICAGLFPLIHLGRAWYFYWIVPYPNNRGSLWVNFRSPLLWDFFAIGTYFSISLIFWYMGMVPDLATLRDRLPASWRRTGFRWLSLGWNGSARTWRSYEVIYALLAVLATPLVVSVHSIVSFDFATSILPGWHSTIFPPYFVAGAIFSGLALVILLLLVARKTMGLQDYITIYHFNWLSKLMLLAGVVVALSYVIETFMGWYSGNVYEIGALRNRAFGPYGWAFWTMMFCNVVAPQALWFRYVRRSLKLTAVVSVCVVIGMWLERFVIIVTSLYRDYLPSSWSIYRPTLDEYLIHFGVLGLFLALYLLFARLLPFCSIEDLKGVIQHAPPASPQRSAEQ